MLWDDRAEPSDIRTTDQSKARWLGGGTRFFSTHKLTAHAMCVACPGNLAALKLPLGVGHTIDRHIMPCYPLPRLYSELDTKPFWLHKEGSGNNLAQECLASMPRFFYPAKCVFRSSNIVCQALLQFRTFSVTCILYIHFQSLVELQY